MKKSYNCAHSYCGTCMKQKIPCDHNIENCTRVSTAREIALNYLNYHFHKDGDFYSHSIDYPLGNNFVLTIGDDKALKSIRIALFDGDEPVDLTWGARTNLGSIHTTAQNLQFDIENILSSNKRLLGYASEPIIFKKEEVNLSFTL